MPLSISRGKVHEYLGMIFDFINKGEVYISMYQYITGVIKMRQQYTSKGLEELPHHPITYTRYEIRDQNLWNSLMRKKNMNIIILLHS